MTYLITAFSAFAGALVALVGYNSYLKYQKTKAVLIYYNELKKTIEDEITFVEIAEQLSKDMNYDD